MSDQNTGPSQDQNGSFENLTPKEREMLEAFRAGETLPPETQTLPETPTSRVDAEPGTETKGSKPNWVRRALVGATGTAAVIATVIAGKAAGSDDKEAAPTFPTSSSSAPQNATPSPSTSLSAEPSPTPTPELPVAQTDIEHIAELRTKPIEKFNQLEWNERSAVLVDQYYRMYKGSYHAYFTQKVTNTVEGVPVTKFLYEYNPLDEASPASELDSDQTILNRLWFQEQATVVQKMDAGVDGVGELNINQALQMTSGLSYYVGNEHPELTKNTYGLHADSIKSIKETTGMAERIGPETRLVVAKGTQESQLKSGVDEEGNPIVYKDINYEIKGTGLYYTSRVVIRETPPVELKDLVGNIVPVKMKIWTPYSTQKLASNPQ